MWRDYPPGPAQFLAGFGLIFTVLIAIIMVLSSSNDEQRIRAIAGDRLAVYRFDRDLDGFRILNAGAAASFDWEPDTGQLIGSVQINRGHVATTQTDTFTDTVITATVSERTPIDGTTSSIGLTCRTTPDGNGYYFLISSTGAASIRMGLPDNPDDLGALADWTTFDSIQPTTETNTLRVTCAGDTLALAVNGTRVLTAQDTTYARGLIGVALAGGALPDANPSPRATVRAAWDNITVYQVAALGLR